MLCLILIVGGLLIMMGQHDRSEALFYYFRLEDQVPETHLLRLIEGNEYDTIYHEHVTCFSLHALARVSARAGLMVVETTEEALASLH